MICRTRTNAFVFFVTFRSFVTFVTFVFAACGGSSPTTPGGAETITGGERFGWDQPAADAGELGTFRYAIYLDDARSEATGVSCAAGSMSGRFACASSLPPMSTGSHTLQVAAFVLDAGIVRESARSAAVRVIKR